MRTRRHPQTVARHALRFGGLVLVLAGLFGMHGLASHGSEGMDTTSHSAMVQMPMVQMPMGTAVEHLVSRVEQVAPAASTVPDLAGHGAMGMGMAAMCLAILTLALIALLLLLAGRVRPLLWLVAPPVRAPMCTGRRDPDPPSLIKLSIQRC